MRGITRTISSTVIHVAEFAYGELRVLEDVIVPGAITDNARVMKAVRNVYGKEANIVVTGTEVLEEKRTISFENFMRYSEASSAEPDEDAD